MAKKETEEQVPDYNDGTWYVPAGKSSYEKKPEEEENGKKPKKGDE